MRIEDQNSFIDFQFFDSELEYYPSSALSIEVASDGFTGHNQRIWFSLPNIESFVRQLETLEHSRQGEARLRQMHDESEFSPFRFKIWATDSVGHLAVSAEISQLSRVGNRGLLAINKVAVTFEIDPGSLPDILKNFKRLFAQHQP